MGGIKSTHFAILFVSRFQLQKEQIFQRQSSQNLNPVAIIVAMTMKVAKL